MGDPRRLRKNLDRASRQLEAMVNELAEVDDALSADDWLSVRARIGLMTADFNDAVAEVDRLVGTTGARARILRYMQIRLGETVSKEELSGVAGIHEWARRVRELRQDLGWDIHSVNTRDGLGVGDYVLIRGHADPGLAGAWTSARKMRNLRTAGGKPAPKTRVLEFLKEIYPRGGDTEQLAHVAGSAGNAESAIADLIADGWALEETPSGDESFLSGWHLVSLDRDR